MSAKKYIIKHECVSQVEHLTDDEAKALNRIIAGEADLDSLPENLRGVLKEVTEADFATKCGGCRSGCITNILHLGNACSPS
jgi:hypothetical protein